jgi:hypothetical protein
LNAVFLALAPIFALIGLGWLVRRAVVADDAFWQGVDRLTYFVLLPALLFRSIAMADLARLPVVPALATAGLAVLAVWLILLAMRRSLGLSGGAFGSLVQGSVRTNTYIAFAAALTLFGEQANAVIGLAVVAFIPLVNLVSVFTLARYGGKGKSGGGRWAALVLTNPLILACAAGAAANYFQISLPRVADATLDVLGRAALPMGLLAVGAGLEFKALAGSAKALVLSSVFKLAVLPAFVLAGVKLAALEGPDVGTLLLFGAAPCALSAYTLARQMGGDAKLMAGIITLQTLLALATLPAWLWLRDFWL